MHATVLFKVVVLGDTGSGKTSLLKRFVDEQFSDACLSTIGVDFKQRTIELHGRVIKMQLWDTAGQERFQAIGRSYYHGAHAYVIVYSVANSSSFYNVRFWASEVRAYGSPNVPALVVANKADLNTTRVVTREMGLDMAGSIGAAYAETSAKTSVNVEHTFLELAREIYQCSMDGKLARVSQSSDRSIRLVDRGTSHVDASECSYYSRVRQYSAHMGCC